MPNLCNENDLNDTIVTDFRQRRLLLPLSRDGSAVVYASSATNLVDLEDMRYTRGTTQTLNVPAGTFKTLVMQREGEPGDDRRRVGRSWFAESLGWLPVQIEQTEKKGDTVTLKLVSSSRK